MNRDESAIVSIVVVSFNTKALTLACLKSIYDETQNTRFELIVVDNASSDDSASEIKKCYPEIRLIASDKNLGFARANNLAVGYATGKYILLLNPDTVVLNGAITKLLRSAVEYPAYGIYGGRTVFPDGTLNSTSCWRRPTVWNAFCRASGLSRMARNSPVFSSDNYGGWRRDTFREVDIVSGCFLLIRRLLWEELGGFDTSYFMYGEDWDLCLRAHSVGARCFFSPDAVIVHFGGASEPIRSDKLVRLFQTKVKLYRTHWGAVRSRVLILMLHIWTLRGLTVCKMLGLAGDEIQVRCAESWRDVWRRRKEWSFHFGQNNLE